MMTERQRESSRLQFISHHTSRYSYLDGIRMALQGGCRWIQLRMKGASDEEVLPVAREVQRLCREADAVFIIDDRVELVLQLSADGVHLGKNDMPVSEARKMLGSRYIIGGTANTLSDVRSHHSAGADYIGCGPFRFTTTKEKLSPILGAEGYRQITEGMQKENIQLPVVAIGGITADDIPLIMSTGVSGIALSGEIMKATSPVQKTRQIIDILNHSSNKI